MSQTPDRSIRVRNAVIVVAVVGVIAVLLWLWGPWPGESDGTTPPADLTTPQASDPLSTDAEAEPLPAEEAATSGDPARVWTEVMGEPPAWPEDALGPSDCEGVREELAKLCTALDARTPALRGQGGACGLLEQLSDALAANPPDLSSELRDYETLLGNVFHLFRVTGRERMGVLRTVLADQQVAEPAALVLYRWASSRERCAEAGTPRAWGSALYAYSGFLFNTLGGQAYLRRRSPRVEALTCFYGLQLLDGTIRGGHNPSGLDPRAEIPRCRDLVVSQPLVFSERYVAALDEMSRRWDARGARQP